MFCKIRDGYAPKSIDHIRRCDDCTRPDRTSDETHQLCATVGEPSQRLAIVEGMNRWQTCLLIALLLCTEAHAHDQFPRIRTNDPTIAAALAEGEERSS